ncbi:hypothetical protein NPX13_g7844 [Xylaria arbuscula]|uniref:Uncharacterized protein n=1 Tax=Xylaria arbuscula TaxID=114810 RepID=A0A9W8NA40_9PEZI|nr:hypothetical protein NPX13_g7844 [Xylaria arbuscula]
MEVNSQQHAHPTDGSIKNNGTNVSHPKVMWRSAWLHKRTLVAFILLVVSLLVSLSLLWWYDITNDGIKLTISSNHYIWAYGPTAILVVVVSIWRQIDYQCKVMQPWLCMQYHTSSAENSILLDYISSLQVTSFYKAISNRHWPVACSILGFAALKVAVLASTSLLTPSDTLIVQTYDDARLLTTFNTSQFWETIPFQNTTTENGTFERVRGVIGAQMTAQEPSYLNVSADPIYTYWAQNASNFSFPFQSFDVPKTNDRISRLSMQVDAFIPNVTCEVPRWTSFQDAAEYDSPLTQLELDTPTCSVGRGKVDYLNGSAVDVVAAPENAIYCWEGCPDYPVSFTIQRVNCADPSNWKEPLPLDNTTPHDFRFALIAANISDYHTNDMARYNYILQAGVVLCNIDYNIIKVTAMKDAIADTYSIPEQYEGIVGDHLSGLSGLELSEIVYTSLCYSAGGFALGRGNPWFLPSDQDSLASNPIFSVMTSHLGGPRNPAIITLTTTRQATPQDPRPTATHASILAASPSLQGLLQGAGSLRTSELKSLLEGFCFKTVVGKKFQIEVVQHEITADCLQRIRQIKTGTWLPSSAKLPFVSLTLTLPVLAIGVLEILYRVSTTHEGLADAPADSLTISYGVQLSSSLIILLISTCFNSLDFTIVTFAPFGSLRTGVASTSKEMLANLPGITPLLVLYHSMKRRQFELALSTLATLIGSLLAVFSSGLWVLDNSARFNSNCTTSANHTWNLTPSDALMVSSGTAMALSSIERNVTGSPPNVWEDLVFPHVSEIVLSGDPSDSWREVIDTVPSNYALTLPALRPELDCAMVPTHLIDGTVLIYPEIDDFFVHLEADWDLPRGCHGGPNANRTYLNIGIDAEGVSWYAKFRDAHMGPWNITNVYGNELGDDPVFFPLANEQQDNPLGCPSIVSIFGHINLTHDLQNALTIFVCNQKIQQIDTTVTYIGDPRNGVISLSQPPVTDESTATYLNNGTKGIDTFNYRIEYDVFRLLPFSASLQDVFVDSFFNHILYGPDGISAEHLSGPENAPRLLEAIQKLYKRYMVQMMNSKFRQPFGPSQESDSRKISGTVTRAIRRLTVNYPSKLALQITLATMTVLSALAFRLAKLRGTLPRNPCSIASVMGFLAGSRLCSSGDILPEGAEWMTLEELNELLNGHTFSLGWWPQEARAAGSDNGENSMNTDETSPSQQTGISTGTRFGIDVGTPLELGYRRKEARKRAIRGSRQSDLETSSTPTFNSQPPQQSRNSFEGGSRRASSATTTASENSGDISISSQVLPL